jgi:hypothetical protein
MVIEYFNERLPRMKRLHKDSHAKGAISFDHISGEFDGDDVKIMHQWGEIVIDFSVGNKVENRYEESQPDFVASIIIKVREY